MDKVLIQHLLRLCSCQVHAVSWLRGEPTRTRVVRSWVTGQRDMRDHLANLKLRQSKEGDARWPWHYHQRLSSTGILRLTKSTLLNEGLVNMSLWRLTPAGHWAPVGGLLLRASALRVTLVYSSSTSHCLFERPILLAASSSPGLGFTITEDRWTRTLVSL